MKNAENILIAFLNENPGTGKTAISEAINMKGLPLYNLLKKLVKEGSITEIGTGTEQTYSIATIDGGSEETLQNADQEQEAEEVEEIATAGRDNSKYTFNKEQYGKGPLVRAVVAQYVADNKNTTYAKLKQVFPDELLKRFGIFQDVDTAAQIANKGNRYFTKPDHKIKLKDKEVVVCNQFTLANIQPFLKAAKALGYKIR